jgi:NAD-dependent deacetylase
MSAESGIPTFRETNGLWRNYRVEEVASPDAWQRDPQLVWDFYSMRRTVAATAQPNPGHRALAALEHTLGSRLFLCTQNVDNLHEQAGSRPLHMHGELFKSRCERCRVPFEDTNIYHELPLCTCSGRSVRTFAVRRNAVWDGSCPAHSGSLHGLHCNRDFRDGRTCREFRRTDQSADVLRRPGRAAQPCFF